EPGDVDGLARGLVELARDEALRRRMGEAAAARARAELSVARHVDAMERVLLEAAALRGS
ncbi:MAG TPA: glycosyltransferase family 1 protein, partial [Methylomirabilota bacterium]|nr:glycosyltransferase family 1 protein [Methylomirabilota bacterium]